MKEGGGGGGIPTKGLGEKRSSETAVKKKGPRDLGQRSEGREGGKGLPGGDRIAEKEKIHRCVGKMAREKH